MAVALGNGRADHRRSVLSGEIFHRPSPMAGISPLPTGIVARHCHCSPFDLSIRSYHYRRTRIRQPAPFEPLPCLNHGFGRAVNVLRKNRRCRLFHRSAPTSTSRPLCIECWAALATISDQSACSGVAASTGCPANCKLKAICSKNVAP